MNHKIPFYDYTFNYKNNSSSLKEIFNKVCLKGAYILQDELLKFENEIKNYTKAKYVLGVGNATDAMQMFLMCSNLKKNSEIIISSHTMVATASAVYFAGYKPVPVAFGDDLLIDPKSIIKSITPKTKGLLITHLNGRTCNMDEIMKICKKYKLELFEDAAQALGSKYKGKYAGTFGLASTISLYPAKILGCFGDGGLILTNNKKLFSKLHKIRSHGINEKTKKIDHWGFNSRLDNLQAAFLSFFFKKHNENINRRRNLAKIYHKELSGLKTIKLPPACENKINYDIFQNYEIICEKRNKLKSFLDKKGIGTLIQWNGVKTNSLSLPNINKKKLISDSNFNKLLLLPMNISLKDSDVKTVCNEIKKFYK